MHSVDHVLVDVTLCKLQSNISVLSPHKIIKSVEKNVMFAGNSGQIKVKVKSQSMGQISNERKSPCPPFYHTALNILGLLQIKDNIKKRTAGEASGVIIIARAVYIDVVDEYDT